MFLWDTVLMLLSPPWSVNCVKAGESDLCLLLPKVIIHYAESRRVWLLLWKLIVCREHVKPCRFNSSHFHLIDLTEHKSCTRAANLPTLSCIIHSLPPRQAWAPLWICTKHLDLWRKGGSRTNTYSKSPLQPGETEIERQTHRQREH